MTTTGVSSGVLLGPYEILGPIGRGGMGEVYRARDGRLDREVAIKVLPADVRDLPDRLGRFKREAKAVAALNHPNILALHDVGTQSGVAYAVMELLEGETLRSRLEQSGRLAPLKAIDYAVQMARGLAAAHDRGIVHRDLKPENLFITRDGRIKILDFGLAALEPTSAEWTTNATRFATESGVVLGTPAYMSPEQLRGEPATVRSDLFTFGVVLYEMLAGVHPFRRQTVAETMTAILREEAPPLAAVAAGLPAGISRIVDRCLDKHAEDRPTSARDLAMFFEGAATGDPSPADRAITTSELNGVRNRVLAISCAVLVVLCMATWSFVSVMADRAVDASIEADLLRAARFVERVHRDRLATLNLTARLVASFPELKALLATDAATVRDYLRSYRERNRDVPMLVALDNRGTVIAHADDGAAAADDDAAWAASVAESAEPTIVTVRGVPYHAASAAAEAGGAVFGRVVGAMPIDNSFAASVAEATRDDVVVLSDTRVVASTLKAGQAPWTTRDDWRRTGGGPGRVTTVDIGVQRFVAREVALSDQPAVSAVILKSRDEMIAPFRRIENGIVLIGLLSAAAAAAGSVWVARVVTASLQR